MATTNCLRVARFVPMSIPRDGDVVQVQTASSFLTRFVALPTVSAAIPFPTAEGDVLQADATLAWVALPADGGTN